MGRGRAKAKQRGLARELKYNAPETDFKQLQAELSGEGDAALTTSDSVEKSTDTSSNELADQE